MGLWRASRILGPTFISAIDVFARWTRSADFFDFCDENLIDRLINWLARSFKSQQLTWISEPSLGAKDVQSGVQERG
jgi:hypothetical protein